MRIGKDLSYVRQLHPRQVSDLGLKCSNAHFFCVAKKLTSWLVYIHYLARWSHIIDEDLLRCIHNDDDAIYPLLFIVSRMYQLLSNIVFHRLGWCHQRLRVKHLSQETPCNSTSVIPSIIILFYQIKCVTSVLFLWRRSFEEESGVKKKDS